MLFAIATLLAGLTCAQSWEKDWEFTRDNMSASYPKWAEKMEEFGITWMPYTVETEDGWSLTMFRLTGRIDKNGEMTRCENGKYPVIIQHGGGMDATSWAVSADLAEETGTIAGKPSQNFDEWYTKGDAPWPMQMVDHCYDVWMPNNRGTRYSNVTKNDPQPDSERWNYTFKEYGLYDQPAFIDKILDVTKQEKVTYVGYSAGTAQMFYGLSKLHDSYYADRLNRFVALAPCVMVAGIDSQTIVGWLKTFNDNDIYYFAGENWSERVEQIQSNPALAPWYPFVASYKDEQPVPTAAVGYMLINGAEEEFQEPISIKDYANGVRRSPQVDLSVVNRVPISLVIGEDDTTCTPANARSHIFDKLGDTEKNIRYEQGFTHYDFEVGNSRMLARVIETIEYGQAKDDGTKGDMYGDWNGSMKHDSGHGESHNKGGDDESMVNIFSGLFEMDGAMNAFYKFITFLSIILQLLSFH